jgi:putative ABC transport system substrate-binding protein
VIERRAFVVGALGLLAAPLAVEAQPAGKVYRIGYLVSGGPPGHSTEVFIGRLRELGYQPGRNLELEFRSPRDAKNVEQLRELAAELVSLRVDILVAAGPPAAEAAQRATGSIRIPVVIVAVDDPVGRGLIKSLARPGGNVTGSTWDVSVEMYTAQTLAILKQALPKSARVAFLWNLDNPAARDYVKAYQNVARSMGLMLLSLGVSRPEEFEDAFNRMAEQGADAVIVGAGHMAGRQHRKRIAELATSSRLPTICGWRKWIVAGCLISYGPYPEDMYRRAAEYVDKILKGARPADLPVEQPTKFELVINLKTAKTLGLTIPQSLLQRADQVIK